MINSREILTTGIQVVTSTTPVTKTIKLELNDFVVMGILSSYTVPNTASFLITILPSRDTYSSAPLLMDPYGCCDDVSNLGTRFKPMYSRKKGKALFVLKGSSNVQITLYTTNGSDTIGLSLYGYYIDAAGRPAIEGSSALPAAIAAKL